MAASTPPPGRGPGPAQRRPPSTTLPTSFSAFVVTQRGDSIDAGVRTLDPDALPAGEVTISVDWSAVNYKDGMVTRPANRVARVSPLIPGVDLVGTRHAPRKSRPSSPANR